MNWSVGQFNWLKQEAAMRTKQENKTKIIHFSLLTVPTNKVLTVEQICLLLVYHHPSVSAHVELTQGEDQVIDWLPLQFPFCLLLDFVTNLLESPFSKVPKWTKAIKSINAHTIDALFHRIHINNNNGREKRERGRTRSQLGETDCSSCSANPACDLDRSPPEQSLEVPFGVQRQGFVDSLVDCQLVTFS